MKNQKMKMKELKDHLQAEGYDISERMVKYYIELGILPVPEYPYPNQALYSHIHLIRLKRIAKYKQEGYAFSEIKRIIFEDERRRLDEAEKQNISIAEYDTITASELKEEADFVFSCRDDNNRTYTKEEMLRFLDCDKLVFDLAVDTGALKIKESYDIHDLSLLLSIRNLIEMNQTNNGSSNIIEKISEISKLNNIAAQIANIYSKQKEKAWIYDYLLEMLIAHKMKAEQEHSFSIGKSEFDI